MNNQRVIFIDYLRAFAFTLLILDHTIHAYAETWGQFWFFKDLTRTWVCDVLYLHNNSIIMPLLFMCVGMWVLPASVLKGVGGYLKDRLVRLGIPFVFGIPLIVPLLSYPRYHFYIDPTASYWEFWSEIFFSERLQAGPFWVMYALILYSFITLALAKIIPGFHESLGRWVRWMASKPVAGVGSFMVIAAVILGLSDLTWGAPWWIGFGKLFYLQGSRFLLHGLFFLLGAGISASGLLRDDSFWQGFSRKWPLWFSLMLIAAAGYISYSLLYRDIAYDESARKLLAQGGSWDDAWKLYLETAPSILLRTSLHGIFVTLQALTYTAIIRRFLSSPRPPLTNLARNSYGMFIWHETMVVWMQLMLANTDLPIALKIAIIFPTALFGSWLLNDKVMGRIQGLQRVVRP